MSAIAPDGADYEYQPSFILGFHGCDASTGEAVLRGELRDLRPSEKAYDWLGHGIYFWEGNLARAWAWARQRVQEGKIQTPFVLGAIIDLRHCLDLFNRESIQQVRTAHEGLAAMLRSVDQPIPKNVGPTPDKAGRMLDCAVVNALHQSRKEQGLASYDSVRGPFLEGAPIYEGAGFRDESHIQICVRAIECIKGYFRPIVRRGSAVTPPV